MECSMHLRKVCPQWNTTVHVKRSVWGCGFVFPLKRKVRYTADTGKLQAMKHRRVLESEEQKVLRKDYDRVRKVIMRASETREQTLHRQEQNRIHMMSMRASEMCEQTLHRQEQDKMRAWEHLKHQMRCCVEKTLIKKLWQTNEKGMCHRAFNWCISFWIWTQFCVYMLSTLTEVIICMTLMTKVDMGPKGLKQIDDEHSSGELPTNDSSSHICNNSEPSTSAVSCLLTSLAVWNYGWVSLSAS